jgi:phosphomannomutase
MDARVTDLIERANQWIAHDPDPATRAELKELVARARNDDAARAQLAERFIGPLEFGTAGLRGVIGAGESLMNRAVVRRTSAGLARYLLAQRGSGDSGPSSGPASVRTSGVVIGYDGRRLSRELAEDTAAVLAASGIPSFLATHPVPTPVTAFAVTRLRAAAGVMVTASHNPPEYNGYKVYWSNGAQIIPPHDKGIAAAVAEQPPADEVKLLDLAMAREKNLLADWPADLEPAYLAAIANLGRRSDGDRSFPIVYTALHGVGNRLVLRALEQAGFTRVKSVPEQAEPDGAFPTVRFPNPEEKGALDLAFALADREKADLIIANDPDVDRLAVAVRGKDGRWVQLTGNEVGALLGHYLLTEGQDAAGGDGERAPSSRAPTSVQEDRLVLASCVSSPMLGAICRELGVRYEETLTGFKWIANRAMELERTRGARFVFGYEEALGYTVGPLVRDKDGISAALVVAEVAAVRRARGETLLDELAALARRYGVYLSGQRAITLPGSDGLAKMGEVMAKLRAAPPERVGGLRVTAVSDYQAQTRREGGKSSPLALPKTNMLTLELEGGSRIIARPSGTEPKIKFYFDLREEVPQGEATAGATGRAQAKLAALADDFVRIAGV